MKNSNTLAFLFGALAGAAVVYLFTSEKGGEWRRMAEDFARAHADKFADRCTCGCGVEGCQCKEGECTCHEAGQ